MKSQSYMTRALRARDPRFATILGNLGYERGDLPAAEPGVSLPSMVTSRPPVEPSMVTSGPPQAEKANAKRKPARDKASS